MKNWVFHYKIKKVATSKAFLLPILKIKTKCTTWECWEQGILSLCKNKINPVQHAWNTDYVQTLDNYTTLQLNLENIEKAI